MVKADPEFAIVHIGYRNFAAAKILDALLASGLKRTDIETEDIALRQPESENGTSAPRNAKESGFEAIQEWAITTRPEDAHNVVDRAIAAGTNDLQSVVWIVANPGALDVKASALALDKARDLASQMAQPGGKIGQVLFRQQHAAWHDELVRQRQLWSDRYGRIDGCAQPAALPDENSPRRNHLCGLWSRITRSAVNRFSSLGAART